MSKSIEERSMMTQGECYKAIVDGVKAINPEIDFTKGKVFNYIATEISGIMVQSQRDISVAMRRLSGFAEKLCVKMSEEGYLLIDENVKTNDSGKEDTLNG